MQKWSGTDGAALLSSVKATDGLGKGLALIGKGLRSGNPPTPRAKNKSAAEKLHICLQLL